MKQTLFGKHPSIPNLLCSIDGDIIGLPHSIRKTNGRGYYNLKVKLRLYRGYIDKGYILVKYKSIRYRVHKLVLETFVGIAPIDKPYGLHRNDIKNDARLENLYWGNGRDNTLDAFRNKKRSQINVTEAKYKTTVLSKKGVTKTFSSRKEAATFLGCSQASVSLMYTGNAIIKGWVVND